MAADSAIAPYHVNGLSPDGRTIAIGWGPGPEACGTYLLDLQTGARTNVPQLNNGAISPDGHRLLNAVYAEEGKTDLIELDIESGAVERIASHPEWDWLPSYSPDGSKIAFNSYRTGRKGVYRVKFDGSFHCD